jgi:osmoprotectant transport system permease protein
LVGWGGLGRFIVDGFSVRDNVLVFAGALLVAGLAMFFEVLLGWVERHVVPATLQSRSEVVESVVA